MVEAILYLAFAYGMIGMAVAAGRRLIYVVLDGAEEFAVAVLWLPLFIYFIIKMFVIGCFRLAKRELL